MNLLKTLAVTAALALAAPAAIAMDMTHGDLVLEGTWTRATPPKAMAGGGFVTITNKGTEADRLVSAASPVAGRVEIHEMAVTDGVMKMRELENGLPIPAGETVALKPGGFHIMFMQLNQPFKMGEKVPVTLTFEKGGEVEIQLDVQKMGAKAMDHSKMDHGKMDHSKMDHSKTN